MKSISIATIVACLTITHAGIAYSYEYKDLISARDECTSFGDSLVKKQGDALAEVGQSPVDIRNTVQYYCIKGFESASTAKSPKEIEQWRTASLRSLSGIVFEIDRYKTLVINTVYKKALAYYNTQHAAPAPDDVTSLATKIINKSDKYDGDTLIVNNPKKYVAVISYNIEGAGCDTKIKDMTISEVILDKDERHVESMRFKERQSKLDVNFNGLDNASRSWADKIFKLDDKVSVNIMICGSGGFESMIGIAKPVTKDFPTAGVQINVPR
ncbi:hypothetical protein RSG19_003941 [Yersinia enterocolitica]|nr:hypothetical protein [Yersinia enterocolitica]ELI8444626.1 hypothetical protein [Yersinia enterocolitica]